MPRGLGWQFWYWRVPPALPVMHSFTPSVILALLIYNNVIPACTFQIVPEYLQSAPDNEELGLEAMHGVRHAMAMDCNDPTYMQSPSPRYHDDLGAVVEVC